MKVGLLIIVLMLTACGEMPRPHEKQVVVTETTTTFLGAATQTFSYEGNDLKTEQLGACLSVYRGNEMIATHCGTVRMRVIDERR